MITFISMEEAAEKIIVFDAYDTVVQANLVKTKLDAYGIPCFLSEENFTSWYPFRNQLFTGVRLHIFEKDADRVREVLMDSPLVLEETLCPKCKSKRVVIMEIEHASGWKQVLAAVYAVISPPRKVNRCNDCRYEWD